MPIFEPRIVYVPKANAHRVKPPIQSLLSYLQTKCCNVASLYGGLNYV